MLKRHRQRREFRTTFSYYMQKEVIKLSNLVQGHVYYDLRHAIYWPKGCAPSLTAAMGMGGGFVPLLVAIDTWIEPRR